MEIGEDRVTLEVLDDILDDDGQIAPSRVSAKAKRDGFKRSLAFEAAEAGAPANSYWVGASREQLRDVVATRQEAMQKSKFGRIPSPFLAEKA